MELPSFTIGQTATLSEILGDVVGSELTDVAMTNAAITFRSNIKSNDFVLWEGEFKRVRAVDAYVNTAGAIEREYESGGRGPVKLLANSPGLNVTGIQWTIEIRIGRNIWKAWTFDALGDGQTLDLSTAAPVPSTPASGVLRGPRGYTPWFVKVSDGPPALWQAYDPEGPVGSPVVLVENPVLDAIAALTPANDDILQRKAGAWTNRTPAQLKADLALALGDISGLTAALTGKQAALGYTAENTANKGAPNGYPGLGPDGTIPALYMPSYVDDVLEYANLAGFPATGSTGKIYVDQSTTKIYRWSGSVYIEISPSPGSTDAVAEGSVNKYYTDARADARIALTPEMFGAGGLGATDDLVALNACFAAAAGRKVRFAKNGIYKHGGILTIAQDFTQIEGNGATLLATVDTASEVLITGKNCTIDGLTLKLESAPVRLEDYETQKLRVVGDYCTLKNVTIDTSAAAGIYTMAGYFAYINVTVKNTKADGFFTAEGAHDGLIIGCAAINTGDDGFSIVSDAAQLCHHITNIGCRVINGGARGFSVVGGQHVSLIGPRVEGCQAAGLYIASEGDAYTNVANVTVSGGALLNVNQSTSVDHGAIMLTAWETRSIRYVDIIGLAVRDCRTTASANVRVLRYDTSIIQDIAISGVPVAGGPAQVSDLFGVTSSSDRIYTDISRDGTPPAHDAADKATPVDGDEIELLDSGASFARRKLTWANLKAALSSLFLSKTASANRVYITDGVGAQATTGWASAATASTVVTRDASGRTRFADPSVAADAATKNYVDAADGNKADAQIVASGRIGKSTPINTHPESGGFQMIPKMFNDIAYNTARGGSDTVTVNGSASAIGSAVYAAKGFANRTLASPTPSASDIVVIEVTMWQGLQFGTYYGIQMNDGFCARDVKIEIFDGGAWVTHYNITNAVVNDPGAGMHWKRYAGSATFQTKIRYTLTNFSANAVTSGVRINSLFAVNYSSNLLSELFLAKDGGALYGPLQLARYTTVGRPTAASVGQGGVVYDTTLSKPIYSDGTNWRDATGTVV